MDFDVAQNATQSGLAKTLGINTGRGIGQEKEEAEVKHVGRVVCNKPRDLRIGVDNEVRTRDLNLGKVALYQLSYVHIGNQY